MFQEIVERMTKDRALAPFSTKIKVVAPFKMKVLCMDWRTSRGGYGAPGTSIVHISVCFSFELAVLRATFQSSCIVLYCLAFKKNRHDMG